MASRLFFRQFIILTGKKYLKFTAPRSAANAPQMFEGPTKACCNFEKRYCSVVNGVPIVLYEEIKQLKNHPNILLVDVREPQELNETGQIPTSINIPLGQIAEELGPNVDKGAFKAKYGRDKPERDSVIIFHCRIGKRSQNAAELARTLGFRNTKNYLGSWLEWAEKEGLPK